MTCWAPRSVRGSARGTLILALALALAGCGARRAAPEPVPATLLPADLAIGFLQGIKSAAGGSLLTGERNIPPCRFTDKGLWSGGEYSRLIGRRAPNQVTAYAYWVLFKIEDPAGRDFVPADLGRGGAWNYSLRTPRSARTAFGTLDHCVVGPTAEPAKKMLEALSALGLEVAPEFAFILR